jgi:hypothetical protein
MYIKKKKKGKKTGEIKFVVSSCALGGVQKRRKNFLGKKKGNSKGLDSLFL